MSGWNSGLDVREKATVLHGGIATAVFIALGVVMTLGAIAPLVVWPLPAKPVVLLVMLIWARLTIGFACAEVRVEPARLILRTPLRGVTLRWDQVSSAAVVPTNGNRLLAMVKVTTTEGRSIRVEGAACRWRSGHNEETPVGRMVAEINRRAGA